MWLILLGLWGCSLENPGLPTPPDSPAPPFTLLSWNVHNLFDGVDDGGEYQEFTSAGGWSDRDFHNRLDLLAQGVFQAVPQGPTVVALQELENSRVLETLRSRYLPEYPYGLTTSSPGGTVRVGLLSKLRVNRVGELIPGDPREAGRPILEVEVETRLGPVTLFVNHWKSRIPDPESTESARRAAASLIRSRLLALRTPGVVVGDFNTWPRPQPLVSLGLGTQGILPIGRGTDDVLWEPRPGDAPGTYWYSGHWEALDHIFLTPEIAPDGVCVQILARPPWTGSTGRPRPWSPRDPLGLSDHLPVLLEVQGW